MAQLPWEHNIILIEKVKNIDERFRHMQETIKEGLTLKFLDCLKRRTKHLKEIE